MTNFKETLIKEEPLNKLLLKISAIPLIIALILVIVILFFINSLPDKLPLFYSLPWGEDQLANHSQFLILPLVAALITLVNFILSWYLHVSQSFLKKALLITSLIVTLILVTSFVRIVTIFI